MWLSKKMMQEAEEVDSAAAGCVSISGDSSAIVTDAERRDAKLVSPGGYCWNPAQDESVLVLKGNETFVAGAVQTSCSGLAPGEVKIQAGSAKIVLRNNGNVEISGRIFLNGQELVITT